MANLRSVGAQVDTVYATNCHNVWQNIEALKYQVLPGAAPQLVGHSLVPGFARCPQF